MPASGDDRVPSALHAHLPASRTEVWGFLPSGSATRRLTTPTRQGRRLSYFPTSHPLLRHPATPSDRGHAL